MSALRHIPNIITVFRFVLIPPVAWAILNGRYKLALILFFIAGVSDGVDGFLARVFHWQSRLGSFLDPLADKILTLVCFYCLAWTALIPWWLFAVVLLRDIVIIGGAAAYQLLTHALEMHPTFVSKFNTALQIVVILAVLYSNSISPLSDTLMQAMMYLLFISTLVSGLIYVIIWGRKAMQRQSES